MKIKQFQWDIRMLNWYNKLIPLFNPKEKLRSLFIGMVDEKPAAMVLSFDEPIGS